VIDGTSFITAEVPSSQLFLSDMLPSVVMSEEEDDEDSNGDFIAILEAAADKSKVSASIRWAIAAAQDGSLILELQCLPAAAATLNSIPILKG
jgi:hypothetical protein